MCYIEIARAIMIAWSIDTNRRRSAEQCTGRFLIRHGQSCRPRNCGKKVPPIILAFERLARFTVELQARRGLLSFSRGEKVAGTAG